MSYVKGLEIGQFRGLAQAPGGLNFWVTDAKALKRELEAIKGLSAWSTYRKLEDRFVAMKPRAQKLIEDDRKKVAIISQLQVTINALPKWSRQKPKPSKTWFAKRLINSLDKAIDIATGKVPVYTQMVERVVERVVEKRVEIPAPVKIPAVELPAIVTPVPTVVPTVPEPEAPKEGISTTIILIGLGALTAGYFLFLKKK